MVTNNLKKKKVAVVAYPFGIDKEATKNLKKFFKLIFYKSNLLPDAKKLNKILRNVDGIIAGTEIYDKKILKKNKNLKIISRVGIGLDSIDLEYAKKNNILVCSTPDAPSQSATEVTIAMILNLLKNITLSVQHVKNKNWLRLTHKDYSDISIGVIGAGRIGTRVVNILKNFSFKRIYVNDIDRKKFKFKNKKIFFVSKNKLLKNSDLVSLHVPLTKKTKNLLNKKTMKLMKKGSFIVNTSRGPIVNEKDLLLFLKKKYFSGVSLDVMTTEPYYGELLKVNNCYITPHIGSMSRKSRTDMEKDSVKNLINFLIKKKITNPVF